MDMDGYIRAPSTVIETVNMFLNSAEQIA